MKIVKVGGAVVEDASSLSVLLDQFAAIPGKKALVHGGGREATRVAKQMGLETVMIDGRRVTDAAMLKVVSMVYGGWVNKQIVGGLLGRGQQALGLTGADLRCIIAHKRPLVEVNGQTVDYGFVGDVDEVSTLHLLPLLQNGVAPVFSPITADESGQLLNTNADTIASEVARAFARTESVELIYCFEKAGVMDATGRPVDILTPALYRQMLADGTVSGGMIPKLDNAFAAIRNGVTKVRITSYDNLSGGTLVAGE